MEEREVVGASGEIGLGMEDSEVTEVQFSARAGCIGLALLLLG